MNVEEVAKRLAEYTKSVGLEEQGLLKEIVFDEVLSFFDYVEEMGASVRYCEECICGEEYITIKGISYTKELDEDMDTLLYALELFVKAACPIQEFDSHEDFYGGDTWGIIDNIHIINA